MLPRRSMLAIGPLALVSAGCTRRQARALTVFAAASLQSVLDEAGRAFTAQAGTQAQFSFAASSAIARQIEQGAPADVFISADSAWLDYLQERDLIVASSRRDLLSNRLALIAPAASDIDIEGKSLREALGEGRLAIANPDVPAGRYARAALGDMSSLEDRLAPAENVRAALQFVARGEAPLGIVYDTDALAEPRVRIVALFPPGSHPPIVYPGAVVASSTNREGREFLDFLQTPVAADIVRRHGFTTLEPHGP